MEEVVKPALEAARDDDLCMWKLMSVVALADMLAAYIFEATKHQVSAKDDSAFRHELGKENADFELLFHVAKAHKHVRLTRGDSRVSGADATKVATLGWGMGNYGEGPYGGGEQIVVTDKLGSNRNLFALIESALVFLDTKIPAKS